MNELKGKNSVRFDIVPIKDVLPNPNNPRVIRDEKFEKLKKSLQDNPEMLYARPIVVSEDMVVLGGNMRLRVLQDLKVKKVPVGITTWDKNQNNSFIIKDNTSSGEWDWESLANEWDVNALAEWMDIPEEWSYSPELQPIFGDSDVTEEEIEKRAKEIADKMVKDAIYKDIMCPNCGHEFKIGGE